MQKKLKQKMKEIQTITYFTRLLYVNTDICCSSTNIQRDFYSPLRVSLLLIKHVIDEKIRFLYPSMLLDDIH